MKVMHQWIVKDGIGKYQLLVYTHVGGYFITNTGAFGQREMTWHPISKEEAEKLIENKNEIPGDY